MATVEYYTALGEAGGPDLKAVPAAELQPEPEIEKQMLANDGALLSLVRTGSSYEIVRTRMVDQDGEMAGEDDWRLPVPEIDRYDILAAARNYNSLEPAESALPSYYADTEAA